MNMNWFLKVWKNNCLLILFICLMSVFRSVVVDWYEVLIGLMNLIIVEGDWILIDKMVYDLCVLFSYILLMCIDELKVGDIIVFDFKVVNNCLIKCVVGVLGDIVILVDNKLIINGKVFDYELDNDE